ncbi:protein of unknown function [Nitrospina watsonii]|uniref:Uncharacterized protein n=1 Tax=Nitrospina watsonii TaxID=1323948 RepID=A0ABM9HA59_9BACT|nr:protein of unknown function [Nitrospina watsonii]
MWVSEQIFQVIVCPVGTGETDEAIRLTAGWFYYAC